MTQPITKSQLDALEAAADKVFGKLGIDIEFTRHFLDRVNDERNRKLQYVNWANCSLKNIVVGVVRYLLCPLTHKLL